MNEIVDAIETPEQELPVQNENVISEELTDEALTAKDEEVSDETNDISEPDELEALRNEVKSLKAQLEGERALYGRMSAECAEFAELYPEVSLKSLPDSIWESVKNGVPIAAAYALHERKASLERARAELVNNENSRSSSGSIDSPPTEDYFSPAEVRAMSAAEVRANYSTIIRSMSKWH